MGKHLNITMKKLFILTLMTLTTTNAVEAKRMGFFREMQQACLVEFDKLYSTATSSKQDFCDCYGKGFAQTMSAEQRDRMYKNEVKANNYLPFKQQLIDQGFGDVLKTVSGRCYASSKAFDRGY